MSGSLTHAPNQIAGVHSHPYIGDMSKRKNGNTSRGYVKWNTQLSPHMFCQLLEVWVELLLHSIGDLPL